MASIFGTTATPVSPTAYKTGTVVNKPNPLPLGGVMGKLLSSVKMATPTAPTQPANIFGNTQSSSVSPLSIGVQAKDPAQSVSKPATTLATSQVKDTAIQPTGTTTKTPTGDTVAVTGANNFNANAGLQTQGLNAGGNNQPTYSNSGGAVIPQGGAAGTSQTQDSTQTNTQGQSTPQQGSQIQFGAASPYTVNGGLYGQLIAGLANRSNQPSQAYQDATGQYQNAINNLSNFRRQVAGEQANISQQPIELGFQQGRQQVLTQKASQEDAALQNAVNQQQAALGFANTQQGLQQQALQQAAAGAAPIVMSGGQYQASTLGGGSTDAASGQASGFAAGSRAAVASQNDAQATLHQSNADQISSKLQVIAPTKDKLISFMQKYSLNGQSLPILNQQINTINAQTQPDAYNTMQLAIGDIKSFTQQILQAQGGVTPTDAGNIADSWAQNMQNMTPLQLQQFTNNIEALGQIRLSQEQASAKAARDANQLYGGAPAQGMDANTAAQLQRTQESILNQLPDWAKGGAGALANFGGAIGQTAADAAGGYVAGGVGGAAAAAVLPGVASQFFK